VATLKPDPMPLLHALGLLGEQAAHAAMVGDTRHDVEAGQALAMLTVGATYGFAGEGIRSAAPDRVITDIRELPRALRLDGPHD